MFTVISLEQRDRWAAAFARLPDELKDVHFSPSYYQVHEVAGQEARCAIMDDERGFVIYPFLLCAISNPALVRDGECLYDLQGAFGYNGIVGSNVAPEFLAEFHSKFCAYCTKQRVVAEITRLNPALPADHFAAGYLTLTTVNRNVLVDLTKSEEEIWHCSYVQSARKQVNKGRRNGLTTRVGRGPADVAAFHLIFSHTMSRNGAALTSRHPLDYFQALSDKCPGDMLFYITEYQGKAVAAELVSRGTTVAYSFLGGTLEEAFPLAANDTLKHDIILDLKRRGLTTYCLGGGLTKGDNIYRYKEKFSINGGVDFRLASRIHDQLAFNRLVNAWSDAYPDRLVEHGNKILPYRF